MGLQQNKNNFAEIRETELHSILGYNRKGTELFWYGRFSSLCTDILLCIYTYLFPF